MRWYLCSTPGPCENEVVESPAYGMAMRQISPVSLQQVDTYPILGLHPYIPQVDRIAPEQDRKSSDDTNGIEYAVPDKPNVWYIRHVCPVDSSAFPFPGSTTSSSTLPSTSSLAPSVSTDGRAGGRQAPDDKPFELSGQFASRLDESGVGNISSQCFIVDSGHLLDFPWRSHRE